MASFICSARYLRKIQQSVNAGVSVVRNRNFDIMTDRTEVKVDQGSLGYGLSRENRC